MYARHRGPGYAKMRMEDAPPGFEEEALAHRVGCLLYGPEVEGMCGVEHGSRLDKMVRAWATGIGERTAEVRRIEDKMRRLLVENGLKDAPVQKK